MTKVRIVKCECSTNIYLGSNKVICPVCSKEIILIDDEPFVKDTKIPILNVFKFNPSDLKYFESEYPKDGQEILCIYSNNYSEFFYWENRFIGDYEESYNKNEEPISFSWKPFVKGKDYTRK